MTARDSKQHNLPASGRRRALRDIIPPSEAIGTAPAALPMPEPTPPEPAVITVAEPAVFHDPKPARGPKDVPEFLRRHAARSPDGHVDRAWQAPPRRRISQKAYWIAGALAVLMAGLAVPTFLLSSLRITVVPKLLYQSADFAFTADVEATTLDTARRVVPALAVTLDRTVDAEFEATGSQFVRERARGTVRIYNAFSTAPQPLVATTRLQDGEGRIYRLVAGVVVPGATQKDGALVPASVTAEVIADEPGEKYNIGPTDFSIPGFRGTPRYQGFHAKSEGSIEGGFEGQARVVTAADITRASEELSARAVEELNVELAAKVPNREDFLIPDGGRYAAVTNIKHPPADARADRFVMTVSATGKLWAISRAHIAELVTAHLLPAPAPDAQIVIPNAQERLTVSGGLGTPDATEARFTLSGELAYYQAFKTDTMAASLKSAAPGQAIETLLGRPEVGEVRVKRFPRWLWFTPQRADGFLIAVEPPAA
ncbi:hypothetical protein C4552_00990 [Candidatus Parcubacteria bacterium]|nr:MAG: hypothetical protein C4552_00990 [Candidatus Parcubacteria bacterium]